MKIDKTLKISVTQADVESAIKDLIAKEDPSIIVDEIVFAAKRAGKDTISVKVDAHFGGQDAESVEEPEEEETPEIPEVTDDVEEGDEAPFEGDPVVTEPAAKQSLFG